MTADGVLPGPPAGRALPRLDLLRELTDQSVLDVAFAAGPVTRAEIARRTGISKPTVNEAVRRLERVGLLRPAGNQSGRPGRVATFYEMAPDAGFVVAVDLSPTTIRICAADLFGQPFIDAEHPPPQPHTPMGVADQLRRLVAEALERGRTGHGDLLAVAVSVANPVDPATGAVIPLADTPYPEGLIQPGDVLADLLDAPLLVENDVNLAALAERARGAGRGAASFAYLFVGAGIGMGLIIEGNLVRGARGVAGEVGYLPLGFGSPEGSGRHGLARAVAAHGFAPRDGNTDVHCGGDQLAVEVARDVFTRAAEGDRGAIGVVEREGRAIGEAVAAICAIVDPELVILGGPIGLHPALLAPVQATVDALAPAPTPVVPGKLGETAPLQGALVVALQRARTDLWARSNNAPVTKAGSGVG